MAIYKINNNKSHNKGRRVNESRKKLDWTYWEMPDDYKGPFEYPHYFKEFDGRYIGYVYPPYKSKYSRIDNIEGYQVELYDNGGAEPVGDFTRVFRDLKSAERYVEKMYQSLKNESKSVNEDMSIDKLKFKNTKYEGSRKATFSKGDDFIITINEDIDDDTKDLEKYYTISIHHPRDRRNN